MCVRVCVCVIEGNVEVKKDNEGLVGGHIDVGERLLLRQ